MVWKTLPEKIDFDVLAGRQVKSAYIHWVLVVMALGYLSFHGISSFYYAGLIPPGAKTHPIIALEIPMLLFAFSPGSYRILGYVQVVICGVLLFADVHLWHEDWWTGGSLLAMVILLITPLRTSASKWELLRQLPVIGPVLSAWMHNDQTEIVVFYDETCVMCNASISYLSKRKLPDHLKVAALQGETFAELKKNHAGLEELDSLVLLERNAEGEVIRIKSRGVLWLVAQLPGIHKLVIIFALIPSFLSDMVYDIIARFRKSFQKPDYCPIPPQSIRSRMIP